MNREEAKGIIGEVLAELRQRSYSDLERLIDQHNFEHRDIVGASGAAYQVKVWALWDNVVDRTLRVMVEIDDGGLRAFAPLTDSILVAQESRR